MNEEICACVILKDGRATGAEELKIFCRGQVHQDHLPDQILILDEFPKTSSQKIDKLALIIKAQKMIGD